MMYLITGQPGHGKTAYGIDRAFGFQKEKRAIYAHGIKDFDYERAGWHYLEDPTKWMEVVPHGSVIFLDECYTVFPNRNPGSKVPPHVEAMARHRHFGYDFILVAQQGLQLDPFLRGLYDEHTHVRQTSLVKSKTKLKRWTQYQGNVNGPCADVIDWVRPKYVFDYYTSTTLVTTKRSMPMWMRWVIVGVVFVLAVMLWLKHRYSEKMHQYEEQRTTLQAGDTVVPPASAASASGAPAPAHVMTADEYAKAHLPRFATMPWTAPIYDGAQPAVQPQLFCMSSLGGRDGLGHATEPSCTCVTEQGTRYDLPQPQCRTVALNGAPYNPYKQPSAPPAPYVPPQGQDAPQAHAPAALQGGVIAKAPRALGTFPENPQGKVETYTPPTSLDM
ncbi:zonular occludens toxin domain-containing protein [Xanthomonas sacchari]|uniref:Zonular occludens toxin n=1 Tax=Xanthomonas sacchari TaxID=56458 RepID=A0A2P5Z535_9XANT|nr:zonular occludens toxin domain-containing protein [Xanthomonas sacchari]MDV0438278.1 zonular occludens toxin [Xanthomonas sacchari]PPU83063.1 zonular occludens toxin [Xanthomonas sacchari]